MNKRLKKKIEAATEVVRNVTTILDGLLKESGGGGCRLIENKADRAIIVNIDEKPEFDKTGVVKVNVPDDVKLPHANWIRNSDGTHCRTDAKPQGPTLDYDVLISTVQRVLEDTGLFSPGEVQMIMAPHFSLYRK